MLKAPLVHLFWRAIDRLEYVMMDGRLRLCDLIYGPEPARPTDEIARAAGRHSGHGNNRFVMIRHTLKPKPERC